jgi:hypothetical protein
MRSVIIVLIALLLILPLASAATTIKIKTLPSHDVFISVWDVNFETQYAPPKKSVATLDGDAQYIYEGTRSPFGVLVIVKAFDIQKYREEFGPFNTGGVVQLPNLLPDDYEPPEGNDDVVTDNSTDDDSDDDTAIDNSTDDDSEDNDTIVDDSTDNQNATEEDWGSFTEIFTGDTAKIIYYIIGAIFIIAMVALIVIFILTRVRRPKPIQYGMEPVKFTEKPKPQPSGDKYLDSIEKEIENIDRQIEQYKKRNRLEEAQKRLEEKKRVLEKIKRGEEMDYAKTSGHQKQSDSEHKFKKRFY